MRRHRLPGQQNEPRPWLWLGLAALMVAAPLGYAVWAEAESEQTAVLSSRPEAADGVGPHVQEPPRREEPLAPVIGRSVEGRAIEAFEVGSGDTVLVVIGGIHTGPEAESSLLVERFLAHFRAEGVPDEIRLVFVPVANPDGLVNETRTNANDVDLNRNWPADDWSPAGTHSGEEASGGSEPLSEPEVRALYGLLLELEPAMTFSYHAFAGVVDDNGAGAARELAELYAQEAGYEHIEDWLEYELTGQMIDALADNELPAADIELAEDDTESFERNLRALKAVIGELAGN